MAERELRTIEGKKGGVGCILISKRGKMHGVLIEFSEKGIHFMENAVQQCPGNVLIGEGMVKVHSSAVCVPKVPCKDGQYLVSLFLSHIIGRVLYSPSDHLHGQPLFK